MAYPDIKELYKYREFREIYSQERLIEENLHMKRYQILPIRYMNNDNEVIKRFLIYHSPGTGKSFTALWILLNFIDTYEKPCIILVKSKEAIMEFKQRIASWYTYTFNYHHPPIGISNYQQFIKKYIEFHTYITFCKSIEKIKDISVYEDRLLIIDEVHHFRNTVGNKIIYNKLLNFLNRIKNSRVIFMSATPIFDNYNEITSLVKLIKPNLDFNIKFTPEKLEEIMKGHLSYYGLNPPDTSVNFIGSCIPGIEHFKILKVFMKGWQLQKYQQLVDESKTICNIGISHVKATLGVIHFVENNPNSTTDTPTPNFNNSGRYILKNEHIIHGNPVIQSIIKKQSNHLENYCCKLNQCLDIINSANSLNGPIFIYCNIIDDVGIYYFAALLCAMGYNYVYDNKSAMKYGRKLFVDDHSNYKNLKEIRMNRNKTRWNFTFVTGDKRLCPNVMERLNIFNDANNKNGTFVKVLLGSDILSESVDIMNVRQLHILTPHWNYEKINQIIGRIRRVGSHDALPPEQRSVNIYLYMAYDPSLSCTNSINYSIDYVKYIISEEKYNQALKYNEALQNASIESLIYKDQYNIDSLQYSTNYLNKNLPLYITIACNELRNIFNYCEYIDINSLLKKIPILNSIVLHKIIDIIKTNNIIINESILEYSCGLFFLERSSKVHFNNNISTTTIDVTLINSSIDIFSYSSEILQKDSNVKFNENNPRNDRQNDIISYKFKNGEMENKIIKLENFLDNKFIKEFYDSISQLSYTEMLEVIKHSLKYNLKNIKYLSSPYWLEYNNIFYISYFSCIKSTSYASNKKRSINDFNHMIIYSDKYFKNWKPLKDSKLKELSVVFQNHYNKETSKRINHRMKYVYILCNDFTLRYRDLRNDLNFYSKKNTTFKNLRNINRGRNINNFYDKKELIEMLIYSICFDDLEKELTFIENYKEISVSDIYTLLKNNKEEIIDLIKYILNTVTNNDIHEYCCKRPHQTFLMYTLLSSIPNLIKMTRYNIILLIKKQLNYR